LRKQYELLRHPYFNWVSRSEFYNLMDIVLKVDFLDERKFAQVAAAKARAGAEIVTTTYRTTMSRIPPRSGRATPMSTPTGPGACRTGPAGPGRALTSTG
jgi:hypothetical protein